ncbi:MAG: TetR/AcrR family transcriptional regulator [Firmicutes bacterium]|nr:TetR/AcrR family transcriptional regulator [Bacillota bacterium]
MSKKDLIFKSALMLFTTRGFHDTPTSEIAKQAGVATGTLFHYFSTKEELINELYLECKSTLVDKVMEGVDPQWDLPTRMHKMYFNSVLWGVEYHDKFNFLQQFDNSPNISDLTREEGYNRIKSINWVFDEAREAGLIRKDHRDMLMELVYAFIISVVTQLIQTKPEPKERDELIDLSYSILMKAFS